MLHCGCRRHPRSCCHSNDHGGTGLQADLGRSSHRPKSILTAGCRHQVRRHETNWTMDRDSRYLGMAATLNSNLLPTCVSHGKTFVTQGLSTCFESKLAADGLWKMLPQSSSGHTILWSSDSGNSTCRGQLNWLTATSLIDLCKRLCPSR